MTDLAKWALLLAGLVAIVALIVALPIFDIINVDELTAAISGIATLTSQALIAARGIVNCFLTPVGRTILSVVIGYMILRFLYRWGVQLVSLAYKWIFK